MTLFRFLLALSLLGAAAVVMLGFLGPLAPPFDSFAHFRAHAAVAGSVVALVALAAGPRRLAAVSLALALAAGVTVAPTYLPRGAQAAPDGLTLLQMNLRFDAPHGPTLALIEAARPDVMLLQEVSIHWLPQLNALSADYPHQAICRNARRVGGVAVVSRLPFAAGGGLCRARDLLVVRRIALGGRTLTVGSQHLYWPWPSRQWEQLAALSTDLAQLRGPALIGGDFNAVPWSATVRRYASLAGLRPVDGLAGTWLPSRYQARRFVGPQHGRREADPAGRAARSRLVRYGLPIDHVLASPDLEVTVRHLPATLSDHAPLLVTVAIASLDAADGARLAPPVTEPGG